MSDEKQETIADIVADIRERAENAMRNGERLVHNEAVANMLTFVADRLDAARKRDEERAVEHATRHAEAVARDNCRDCVHNPRGKNYEGGNAAAMREALEAIKEEAETTCEYRDYPIAGAPGERGTCPVVDADWIIDACKTALSKPPRNCDVFGSEAEARSAFIAYYNEVYDLEGSKDAIDTDDLKHDVDGILHDYIQWLFAPAKPETKGEDDGR